MATTFATRVAEVQDSVVDVVTKSQKVVLDQVNTFTAQVSEAVPAIDLPQIDGLPFADLVGTPMEYIEQGFAFAGRMLEAQKDFVLKLVESIEGTVDATASKKA